MRRPLLHTLPHGQQVCIKMLAQTLYGHEGSPLRDPERAEAWRRHLS
jgi:hypothetical protein